MGIDRREFQHRRQQVMEKIGNGTAIFRSAPMAVMHNDVEYTYRQDSDFFYLTGFNEPGGGGGFSTPSPRTSVYPVRAAKRSRKRNLDRLSPRCGRSKGDFPADEAYSIQELEKNYPNISKKPNEFIIISDGTKLLIQMFLSTGKN
jgi:Xaa-Pro aminopeptidase